MDKNGQELTRIDKNGQELTRIGKVWQKLIRVAKNRLATMDLNVIQSCFHQKLSNACLMQAQRTLRRQKDEEKYINQLLI